MRQAGCGQSCVIAQVFTCASSASAAALVTARGAQSIGQHAPGERRVKTQSASVEQESSEGTGEGASPAPPFDCARTAAGASAAVIGPCVADCAGPAGGGAPTAVLAAGSGVLLGAGGGSDFGGVLSAATVAAGAGAAASLVPEAQANRTTHPANRLRMSARC